jgi:hypothetical protein
MILFAGEFMNHLLPGSSAGFRRAWAPLYRVKVLGFIGAIACGGKGAIPVGDHQPSPKLLNVLMKHQPQFSENSVCIFVVISCQSLST